MSTGKLMSAGVFTAIAASLCCITPVLALIAGTGSLASSFSWIAPARPFLIGLTVAVLGFAWYQKLKPIPVDECGCAVEEKPRFVQSKTFLLIVTLFAALMISFPSYAKFFFPKNEKAAIVPGKSNIQTVELKIKGMSCEACEAEVNHEVYKLPGIIESIVSYENRNAIVKFDISKTTIKDITNAVNATGYRVINQTIKN
jgi:mercuric ion transport protein